MILLLIMGISLTGCAYNSVSITSQGDVYCNANVDKPTSVAPSLKADGNTVPVSPIP